jgi:hypothetical protein
MSSYQAPVRDLLFCLTHIADLEAIARLPGFEDAGIDTARAALEECARFNEGVVAPLNGVGDRQPSSWCDGAVATTPGFREAYRQFAEGGAGRGCSTRPSSAARPCRRPLAPPAPRSATAPTSASRCVRYSPTAPSRRC